MNHSLVIFNHIFYGKNKTINLLSKPSSTNFHFLQEREDRSGSQFVILNSKGEGKNIKKMPSTIHSIKVYASSVQSFTCKELIAHLSKEDKIVPYNTIRTGIKRLLAKGLIEKISRGRYRLKSQPSATFIPHYNKELKDLTTLIHKQFPLISFCCWSLEDLKRFSHYLVNMNILFVDVERECEESVFNFLLNQNLSRQVYLKPIVEEYNRYIRDKPTIVVRTLVSEAPLTNYSNQEKRITIEKVLVDSVIDQDFYSFQEYESLRVFRNAFDACIINEKKLLRYASRRNHKAEIEALIEEVKENEVFD